MTTSNSLHRNITNNLRCPTAFIKLSESPQRLSVYVQHPHPSATNQGPEQVNGEEDNTQSDETHSLQPAGEVKVIYGTMKAEPTEDGDQRGDEQETHHVSKQGALLLTKTWVLQPLQAPLTLK